MKCILQCLVVYIFIRTYSGQHTGDFKEPPPTRWGRQRVTRMDFDLSEPLYVTELREEYDAGHFEIINNAKASHGPRRTMTCFDPSPGFYSNSQEPRKRVIPKKEPPRKDPAKKDAPKNEGVHGMIADFEDDDDDAQDPNIVANLYRLQNVKRRPLPTMPPDWNGSLNLEIKDVKRRPLPTMPPDWNGSLNLEIKDVKRRPLPTMPPDWNGSLNLEIKDVKRRPLPTMPSDWNGSLNLEIKDVKRRPLPTMPPDWNGSLNLNVGGINHGVHQLFW